MRDVFAGLLPLLVIFGLLGICLFVLRRQSARQAQAMKDIGERNTRAVEENTAAVRALIAQLEADRRTRAATPELPDA